MAKHKIQLTYDDDGNLAVTHRCTVEAGGQEVSHAEPVEIDDHDGACASLQSLLDANKDEMETRTTAMAFAHVAAVAGKLPAKTKSLKAGGTLGAIGGTSTNQE